MRDLTTQQLNIIHGGMSNVTKVCAEGAGIGMLVGGMLGGLVASPIYLTLMSREGISSSHQLVGAMMVGMGVFSGMFFGSMIGSSSGYLASFQIREST